MCTDRTVRLCTTLLPSNLPPTSHHAEIESDLWEHVADAETNRQTSLRTQLQRASSDARRDARRSRLAKPWQPHDEGEPPINDGGCEGGLAGAPWSSSLTSSVRNLIH